MTRDELVHHNPKSGMIDQAKQKQAERDEISKAIDKYLAKGGKITQVGAGVSNEINPLTKQKYNNSLRPYNDKGMKTL